MDLSSIGLPTVGGATLQFSARRGSSALLILSNQKTSELVRDLERTIHSETATADLPVIQIAHLVSVPRLVRKLAEKDIRRGVTAQRDALVASRSARGLGPSDVTELLDTALDWHGEVTTALGFSDADQQPLVAVLCEDGTVAPVDPRGDIVAAVTNVLLPRAG